jgi:ferredoxin
MTARVRIAIDREQCMGSGSCQFYAPSTFELDDEMKAVVVDPDGDPIEAVRHAAEACPTRAITVTVDVDPAKDGA